MQAKTRRSGWTPNLWHAESMAFTVFQPFLTLAVVPNRGLWQVDRMHFAIISLGGFGISREKKEKS